MLKDTTSALKTMSRGDHVSRHSFLAKRPTQFKPSSGKHQLPVAIERSTLLGVRTQIALQRIQIQEQRTRHLEQEANALRTQADIGLFARSRQEARVRDLEDQLARVQDNLERRRLELELRESKQSLTFVAATEQHARAREAEVAAQLRLERSKLEGLLARVDEMEKVLDAAIHQIADKQ